MSGRKKQVKILSGEEAKKKAIEDARIRGIDDTKRKGN